MKTILITVILLTGVAAPSCRASGFGSSARGTSAAGFLKMGAGARAGGMGEAYSAVADEASALYWNPAALTQLEKPSVTFMHASHLESSYYDYLAYGQRAGKNGAFGAGAQYFNAGEVKETDVTGTRVGQFFPNDLAVSAGYAHKFGGTAVGVSFKLIRSEVYSKASAAAFDVGLLTRAIARDRLRLALTATNLGGKIKFDSEKEKLPLAMRAGAAWKFSESWLAAADLIFPRDNRAGLGLGAEYAKSLGGDLRAAGRLGYNTLNGSDADGFTGFSFGLGLDYRSWRFDYGFLPYGDLGTGHRFSVSLGL